MQQSLEASVKPLEEEIEQLSASKRKLQKERDAKMSAATEVLDSLRRDMDRFTALTDDVTRCSPASFSFLASWSGTWVYLALLA